MILLPQRVSPNLINGKDLSWKKKGGLARSPTTCSPDVLGNCKVLRGQQGLYTWSESMAGLDHTF